MHLRLLGAHNCEVENKKLTSLLVDGVLAIDAGAITSSLPLEEQRRLKTILLTHQHYDHVRDIPTLAMNLFLGGASINIYSTTEVQEIITSHLLNSQIYPDFHQRPPHNPTLKLKTVKPLSNDLIEGYHVLAVPVAHSVPTVGYQLTSPDGKVFFYTGDTGPGLEGCWQHVLPQLLLIEVTASDRFKREAARSGHMSPSLLREELISFGKVRGYLPRVVVVHMSPDLEEEIATEIAKVAQELDCSITLGYEGMEFEL